VIATLNDKKSQGGKPCQLPNRIYYKGCGLYDYAKRPGLAGAWEQPENVSDCVALFADLGNTSVFSRKFRGIVNGSSRKKTVASPRMSEIV